MLVLLLSVIILVLDFFFNFIEYVFPFANGFYLLLTILVYGYIFKTMKNNAKKLNSRIVKSLNSLRVPLLIIISFLFFIVVPNIFGRIYKRTECSFAFLSFCFKFNYISDVFIYILLIPRCQKKLMHIFYNIIPRRNINPNLCIVISTKTTTL